MTLSNIRAGSGRAPGQIVFGETERAYGYVYLCVSLAQSRVGTWINETISGAGARAEACICLSTFVLRPKIWYRIRGRAPKISVKKVACDPSLLPNGKDLLRNVRTVFAAPK